MPIFSKLFGSSKEREAKKYFDELSLKIEKENKPMGEVGWAILRASFNCFEAFIGQIQADTAKERPSREVNMLWEFICFYMFLMLIHAARQLRESQLEKLRNFLSALIPRVTVNPSVNPYCVHWPNDKKEQFIEIFYEMLNERELEYKELLYREYHQFDPSKESQTLDASSSALITLFLRLGYKISRLISDAEKDVATIKSVFHVATHEWDGMEGDKLIAEVKKAN